MTRLEEDVQPLMPIPEEQSELDPNDPANIVTGGLDGDLDENIYGGADAPRRNDATPPGEAD